MTLFGLDLNAGRARAVGGPPGEPASALPLDPPHLELPLAVSVLGERLEVGAAALRLCRRAPHLARTALLLALTQRSQRPVGGKLDEVAALGMLLRRLTRASRDQDGGVLAVPAYLRAAPLGRLFDLAEQAGLRLLGGIASPLALALAAHAEHPWAGTVRVLEADEHALTISTVTRADGEVHLRDTVSLPQLGLRVWRERLLNAVADRCILQGRRDPRDRADTEQALFDRLDDLLNACQQGRALSIRLQGGSWYQSVLMQPGDTVGACAGLARRALEQVGARADEDEPAGAVLVCGTAARLPGLVAGLQEWFGGEWGENRAPADLEPSPYEDFGAGLLEEDEERSSAVLVLPADAVSQAAHGLAVRFQRGELPVGHLAESVPLPTVSEGFLLEHDP
jgi:hypothetical protein